MYKTIKEIDSTALIVKYKDDEGPIIIKNESGIAVEAKNTLLNLLKQFHPFYSNSTSTFSIVGQMGKDYL